MEERSEKKRSSSPRHRRGEAGWGGRTVWRGLPLLIFTLFPRSSLADTPTAIDKVLPCRPTIACTADIVAPGRFELESGYIYRNNGPQRAFPFLAKLSLTDWAQLQLGSNGYSVARAARFFDDVTLGLKAHLLDQKGARPSLAVSATASVPTFAGQTGYVRTYDALFTAYATKDIGWLHVDLNGGINVWRLDDPLVQGFGALALSGELPRPFGVMAEAYVFSDAAPIAPKDGGFLFALTYAPRAWLMFDVGGDVGWFPSTRAWSAFVGLTVIPVVLWDKSGR